MARRRLGPRPNHERLRIIMAVANKRGEHIEEGVCSGASCHLYLLLALLILPRTRDDEILASVASSGEAEKLPI